MVNIRTAEAIPGTCGTWIAPAGKVWDAVRLSPPLGLQALNAVTGKLGAVIMGPGDRGMYFLVPPGTTRAWNLPRTAALGQTSHVVLPPDGREQPPGPYWLISPQRGRLYTDTDDLHLAVETALGLRPDTHVGGRPDLEHLTRDQVWGLHCALCNATLSANRILGTFCTGEGLLTDPTELRACTPHCQPD